jgi:hypothetical protein
MGQIAVLRFAPDSSVVGQFALILLRFAARLQGSFEGPRADDLCKADVMFCRLMNDWRMVSGGERLPACHVDHCRVNHCPWHGPKRIK